MAVKIYIGNIPSVARNAELKELFEKFGKVVECDILKDYGFVHMEDTSDAKAAIAGLNDSLWKGSRIRVEISTTRTQKGEPSLRKRYRPPPTDRHSNPRRSPPPYRRDYSPMYRGRDPRDRFEPPRERYGDPYRGYERSRPYPERRPISPPPRDYRMPPPHYKEDPYLRRPYPRPPSPPPPLRAYYRSRSRSPKANSRHEKRRYKSRSSTPTSSSRSGH